MTQKRATFGPSGNSISFYSEGKKHSYQAPEWIFSKGLDAYEYSAGKGIVGGIESFRKIGEQAKKFGILTSFHTPYYISLSGVEEEKRLKSLDYIGKSLACARAMGADTIVIHAGSASKISREKATELAKDTLYRALCEFPDDGILFGIETMGKINQLGTLDEVIEICTLDKRLSPVVDFGHLNARDCGGVFNTADDYIRVFDKIGNVLGDEKALNLHCHFSKIEYTTSGEKKHLTFEDRIYGPDFEPLVNAIVKENLFPRIICESDGTMAEDALTMKELYNFLSAGQK